MTITVEQINTAIADTLADATGLDANAVQDYDELSEGIIDTPTLQVYWRRTRTDVESGSAQTTFRGVVRQTSLTFHADLYAQQRSHIGEDMAALLPLIDAVQAELEEQRTTRFGLENIEAIESWQGDQTIFDYSGTLYVGARFVIIVRVF